AGGAVPLFALKGGQALRKLRAKLQVLGSGTCFSAENLKDGSGIGLTPQPERAQVPQQQSIGVPNDGFGGEYVRAEMLVQAFQPRRGIRGIAHDTVKEATPAAGMPDIDIAVLESDPRIEVARSTFLREPCDDLA